MWLRRSIWITSAWQSCSSALVIASLMVCGPARPLDASPTMALTACLVMDPHLQRFRCVSEAMAQLLHLVAGLPQLFHQ